MTRDERQEAGKGKKRRNGPLIIGHADLQKIIDYCQAAYPNEACGIFGGKNGRVEKVYLMRNVRPSPVAYEMDAEEQFRVMKDIRQEGLTLAGIFHSHTSSPAYPSGTDVEQAYWPGTLYPNYPEAVYVIISLRDRERPDCKGYVIRDGFVEEVPLTIL